MQTGRRDNSVVESVGRGHHSHSEQHKSEESDLSLLVRHWEIWQRYRMGQHRPIGTEYVADLFEASSAPVCHGHCQIPQSIHSQSVALISTHHPRSQQLGFGLCLPAAPSQSCFPEGRVLLSNLSHPAPRLFLERDASCIVTDAMAPSVILGHSCTALPLWATSPQGHSHLPASSARGNHDPRRTKGSGLRVLLFSVKKARAWTSCQEQEPRHRMSKGKKRSKGTETWVPIYAKQMTSSQSASDPAPVAESLTGEEKHVLKGTLSSPFKNKQTNKTDLNNNL